MPNWLQKILGAVVNTVLPIIIALIQKLVPMGSAHPALKNAPGVTGAQATSEAQAQAAKAHYRATVRNWVKEFLTELSNALVAKGIIPGWLQSSLPLIQNFLDQAIESALDNAGL